MTNKEGVSARLEPIDMEVDLLIRIDINTHRSEHVCVGNKWVLKAEDRHDHCGPVLFVIS